MNGRSNTQKRKCPFCDEIHTSQGLHAHVMNSSGGGHGDFREVPEGFTTEQAELVEEPVTDTSESESGLTSDTHYYFCLWCEQLFKGERGYKIHVKSAQGNESHPDDASIEDRNYTLVPADSEGAPFLTEKEIRNTQIRGIDSNNNFGVGVGLDQTRREHLNAADEQSYEIPEDATKPEQVASVISQNPPLFHDPDTVMEIVDCSLSSFYDGRQLFQNQQEGES